MVFRVVLVSRQNGINATFEPFESRPPFFRSMANNAPFQKSVERALREHRPGANGHVFDRVAADEVPKAADGEPDAFREFLQGSSCLVISLPFQRLRMR